MKGSHRVKVTFEVELLTAEQDTLGLKCDDFTSIIWDILEMQPFPVVDAVDSVTYRIEGVDE